MASVLLGPDNEGEDKHVESELIPRLDESSNLSSSTEKTERPSILGHLAFCLIFETQLIYIVS